MVAKAVLVMVAIILVIFVALVFFRQRQDKKMMKWPPVISKCPDYFVNDGAQGCRNPFQLKGNCPNSSCDFCAALSDPRTTHIDFLKGKNLEDEKQRKEVCDMIGKCGLSWEGVDNVCPAR